MQLLLRKRTLWRSQKESEVFVEFILNSANPKFSKSQFVNLTTSKNDGSTVVKFKVVAENSATKNDVLTITKLTTV